MDGALGSDEACVSPLAYLAMEEIGSAGPRLLRDDEKFRMAKPEPAWRGWL